MISSTVCSLWFILIHLAHWSFVLAPVPGRALIWFQNGRLRLRRSDGQIVSMLTLCFDAVAYRSVRKVLESTGASLGARWRGFQD